MWAAWICANQEIALTRHLRSNVVSQTQRNNIDQPVGSIAESRETAGVCYDTTLVNSVNEPRLPRRPPLILVPQSARIKSLLSFNLNRLVTWCTFACTKIQNSLCRGCRGRSSGTSRCARWCDRSARQLSRSVSGAVRVLQPHGPWHGARLRTSKSSSCPQARHHAWYSHLDFSLKLGRCAATVRWCTWEPEQQPEQWTSSSACMKTVNMLSQICALSRVTRILRCTCFWYLFRMCLAWTTCSYRWCWNHEATIRLQFRTFTQKVLQYS